MDADTARVVEAKLAHLQDRLAFLRRYRRVSRQRLLTDKMLHLAVERALQEAIEACLDMGRRLLVATGQAVPDTNRDVFLRLAQAGVVPPERVETLADMAGFRNVLVHEYQQVDLAVVHRVLTSRLTDLEDFARAVVQHLSAGTAET